MSWDQIAILILGVSAVFLSQDKRPKVQRWGCICGLLSQPAWFYAALTAHQWGILLSCGLYTVSWVRGVWTHWIKPWRESKLTFAQRHFGNF